MAKERSSAERAEKKEKKQKRDHSPTTDDGGVTKKSKKDKKEKKSRKSTDGATVEGGAADTSVLEPASDAAGANGDADAMDVDSGNSKVAVSQDMLLAAMVPFANPLADEKTTIKILKGVKRAAKHKTIKRGVKEVVKSLRKSPTTATGPSNPPALVILAADISPFDVISHIPVLCEDHHVPYVYVASRANLGAAGNTKRPTSVVMISSQVPSRKKKEGADEDMADGDVGDKTKDWAEVYGDLAKVVVKANKDVKI